jgi:hypothetical protein
MRERQVVTFKLREGTHEQAAELVAEVRPSSSGPRTARHAVYLGDDSSSLPSKGVEQRVRSVINDPVADFVRA